MAAKAEMEATAMDTEKEIEEIFALASQHAEVSRKLREKYRRPTSGRVVTLEEVHDQARKFEKRLEASKS
ncbi:MAG: hypothetical protein ABJL17_06850 [Parvibaculum sp.]|uniref:hypothetical protein n=1 Tax=Parvibaculum sp. TaxID=2024848 RepID=UPI0032668BE9